MPLPKHIDDDALDAYVMKNLSAVEAQRVEEHLLTCRVCQQKLKLTDDFVAALRGVYPQRRGPKVN